MWNYFTYITVRMTTNIGTSNFNKNWFNLESTSLSLIIFGFREANHCSDGRSIWGVGDFRTRLWALRWISYNWFSAGWYVRTSIILSSSFLAHTWNEPALSSNFIFLFSESTWFSPYPRFTNHCLNCWRWLLSFSSAEQILLNLTICPYAIDPLPHDRAWLCMRYWCVSVGLLYKSLSNLLPTFDTVTPKKLMLVVELSMVNLIVGCRLFIQLKSSFNFWEPWAHIPKISARYRNHRKGLNSLFWNYLFSNPVINRLEYGEENLVPIAKPLFWWYFNYPFSKQLFFKIMFARLHRLLLKINLSERVSEYSPIVYITPRVRYWGTYTIYLHC